MASFLFRLVSGNYDFLFQVFTKLIQSCAYVYIPELFPTSVRSSGTGLVVTLGQAGSFLAPYTRLLPHLWMKYAFFTCTTLSGALAVFVLHETKDKPIIKDISELKSMYQ